jgi:hypothetical protein
MLLSQNLPGQAKKENLVWIARSQPGFTPFIHSLCKMENIVGKMSLLFSSKTGAIIFA